MSNIPLLLLLAKSFCPYPVQPSIFALVLLAPEGCAHHDVHVHAFRTFHAESCAEVR